MQKMNVFVVVLLTIVVFAVANELPKHDTTTTTTTTVNPTKSVNSKLTTIRATVNKSNVVDEKDETKSTIAMTTTKDNIVLQNAAYATLEQVERKTQMSTTEIMANSQEPFSEVEGSHDQRTTKDVTTTTITTTTKPVANHYHIKLAELVNDQDREQMNITTSIPVTSTTTTTKPTTTTTMRAEIEKTENKKNIIDLYPLQKSETEQRQNLMANDVEEKQQQQQHEIDEKDVQQHQRRSVNYFTGKLLAEEDGGVITEIEQKFRLSELATKAPPEHANLERLDAAIAKVFAAAAAKEGATSSNANVQQIFLERRVKKSFNYDKQQRNATTKTTTTTTTISGEPIMIKNKETLEHPEYSTTKFYNNDAQTNKNQSYNNNKKSIIVSKQYAVLTNPKSKIFRKSKDMNLPSLATTTTTIKPTTTTTTNATGGEVLSAEIVAPTNSEHKEALERVKWRLKAILPVANNNNNNNNKNNKTNNNNNNAVYTHKPNNVMQSTPEITAAYNQVGVATTTTTANTLTILTPKTSIRTFETTTNANVGSLVTGTSATTTNGYKTSKSRTSVHVNLPKTTTTTTTTKATIINQNVESDTALPTVTTTAKQMKQKATKLLNNNNNNNYNQLGATNPTKSSSKPISRPRTLSQLQLKINALDCEIANVPPDAHLWRGNETHELLLPVMVSLITIIYFY